ncbi:MAG: protease modulator HflC [Methylobacteriaceae bacterium]|nr:protease modulator HflC [Methylobacteriaceae bacterium]
MSATLRTALAAAAAVAVVVLFASVFIVQQTQTALVLRFGAVQQASSAPGQPGIQPGLHFKVPLIDNVVYFDRRILDLDLPVQEVIASDQKRLVVDAYARYRIIDPLRFYQTVNGVPGANNRLGSITNSTVRSVLADATFTGIVRTERDALTRRIAGEVNSAARGIGVEVVDVRLRRVDLPEQNSQAVFQRMQTERQREATDIRAQGSQIAQGIRARADRDVAVILAEANRTSEENRGRGDAERNRILAEAYGKDPGFFSFYRTMQAYEAGLKPGDTRMVLSPDSEFFRFFNDAAGRGRSDKAPSGTPTPQPPASTSSTAAVPGQ